MGKEVLKEDLQVLEELIRDAYNKLDPVDKYSYIYDKNMMQSLYGKYPKCFIRLKRRDGGPMGQCVMPYVLPMCNRIGHEDPDIIRLSIKMIQRLMKDDKGAFDINDLKHSLTKLQHHHARYSQPVPTPHRMAGYKANLTRMFKNISNYLDQ